MDPRIWGAPMWASLINVAKVYPKRPTINDINYYRIFYTSLGFVLPCFQCRQNYQKHLAQYPIQLGGRKQLLNWLHLIYNQTRADSNQKEVSYSNFINKYSPENDGQSSGWFSSIIPSQKTIIYLLAMISLILGVYYYFFRNRDNFPFVLR